MKKINALELRQSLSKIIDLLQKTGEPILLEKGRKPAAVIISIEDYKLRFVEKDADQRRKQLKAEIAQMKRNSKNKTKSEELLRTLRNG
jgi:PHD/YefM family antitoxin component YafN of YafNO toxin-antitoxin module